MYMNDTNTFPEINAMNRRDVTEAIKLGRMNWDSLTAQGQADLAPRLRAMEERLRRLDATEGQIEVVNRMLRSNAR